MNDQTRNFYEDSYRSAGFGAQRRYPNEEMCRFIGRNFSKVSKEDRKNMRVLEVGCGSGANLWMLARENFNVYGLDLSEESLKLCRQMLKMYNVDADLRAGDMTTLPYETSSFDVIVDVFSSYCLNEKQNQKFISDAARVLKPGGFFFSYTPSKASDAFTNHAPAKLLNDSTLDGIKRATSPFANNLYPFRFTTNDEYEKTLVSEGFEIVSNERIGRTYRNRAEYFEFVVITGRYKG